MSTAQPARTCAQCGTRAEPEDRFCGNCGAVLPPAPGVSLSAPLPMTSPLPTSASATAVGVSSTGADGQPPSAAAIDAAARVPADTLTVAANAPAQRRGRGCVEFGCLAFALAGGLIAGALLLAVSAVRRRSEA